MFDKTKFLRIHDDATPEPSPQQREVRHDAPCRHCNAPTLMWRGEPWCFNCGEQAMDYAALEARIMANTTPCDPKLNTGRIESASGYDHLSNTAHHTFDGEKGTYSDPKCALCAPAQADVKCPWVALDDDHLERIHAQWLALSPQGREACARYYAEACVAAIHEQQSREDGFWLRQGRHH